VAIRFEVVVAIDRTAEETVLSRSAGPKVG
jgi:hypothetical protein